MSGKAVSIADAVVTAINAKADYSNGYTPSATRRFLVNMKVDRESVSSLLVYVVPGNFTGQALSAAEFVEDYTVRVFVIDSVDNSSDSNNFDETELTNLLTLVEEIQTQVITYSDTNPNTLRTAGVFTSNPIMDGEFLESGLFVSVTEFTFKNYRGV